MTGITEVVPNRLVMARRAEDVTRRRGLAINRYRTARTLAHRRAQTAQTAQNLRITATFHQLFDAWSQLGSAICEAWDSIVASVNTAWDLLKTTDWYQRRQRLHRRLVRRHGLAVERYRSQRILHRRWWWATGIVQHPI